MIGRQRREARRELDAMRGGLEGILGALERDEWHGCSPGSGCPLCGPLYHAQTSLKEAITYLSQEAKKGSM